MPDNNLNNNTNFPPMVCPICGKNFFDVHTFADHMNEHSREEKKRKADEEKRARENQREKDIDNLMSLYNDYNAAKKALDSAMNDYEKRYGGYIFPYSSPIQNILDSLFR